MKVKITSSAVLELINEIETFSGPLDRLQNDSRFKEKAETLYKIIS